MKNNDKKTSNLLIGGVSLFMNVIAILGGLHGRGLGLK